jgi:hypothetical protein
MTGYGGGLASSPAHADIVQLGTSASTKQTLAYVEGFFGSFGAPIGTLVQTQNIGGALVGNTFTAPRTANYLFTGSLATQTATFAIGYELLYLSGATSRRIAWGSHGAGTYPYWGLSGATTVRLTAGQSVQFATTLGTGTQTGGADSSFSIAELPNDFIN